MCVWGNAPIRFLFIFFCLSGFLASEAMSSAQVLMGRPFGICNCDGSIKYDPNGMAFETRVFKVIPEPYSSYEECWMRIQTDCRTICVSTDIWKPVFEGSGDELPSSIHLIRTSGYCYGSSGEMKDQSLVFDRDEFETVFEPTPIQNRRFRISLPAMTYTGFYPAPVDALTLPRRPMSTNQISPWQLTFVVVGGALLGVAIVSGVGAVASAIAAGAIGTESLLAGATAGLATVMVVASEGPPKNLPNASELQGLQMESIQDLEDYLGCGEVSDCEYVNLETTHP